MNNFTIPVILSATILLAGIFAFMPVDQASSVHATIIEGTAGYQCVTKTFAVPAGWDGDTLDLDFTNGPIYIHNLNTSIATNFNAGEDWGVTSATADGAIITLALNDDNASAPEDTEREFISTAGATPIFVQAQLALLIDDNAAGTLDGDEDITFEVCGLVSDPASFANSDLTFTNTP